MFTLRTPYNLILLPIILADTALIKPMTTAEESTIFYVSFRNLLNAVAKCSHFIVPFSLFYANFSRIKLEEKNSE